MRTIDEIIAESQNTTAAALREAFEAGRAHTAHELKARMAAFFDGLVSTGATPPPPPHDPNQGGQQQGTYHQGDQPHG